MAKSAQLARLQARLEAIPNRVREAVQPSLVQSAEELATMMRHLAPVDEGDLRDSIAVTPPGQNTPAYSQPGGSQMAGPLEALVTVGDHDTRYPHLVEYGHSNGFGGTVVPPKPFFWPSVRLLQKKVKSRIKRSIAKAVRESGKPQP